MTGLFEVTAQYSNAVLLAILPHVNQAAKSLDLAPTPVTTSQVREFRCDPREGRLGGVLFLTNGCTFWFDAGHVSGFESAHSYFSLQDPDQIPRFYGKVRVSKPEVIQLARQAIAKLGYELRQIQSAEPVVRPLERIGTNLIPHYHITWPLSLPGGLESILARVEVNGETSRVEEFFLPAREFAKPPPQIDVIPRKVAGRKSDQLPHGGMPLEKVSAERQAEILQMALPEFEKLAKGLKLPVPEKITTDHTKDIQCGLVGGKPNIQIILTNGYRFNYQQDRSVSFYGPDCYFSFEWKEQGRKVNEFVGPLPSKLEPLEELARRALKATGYFKAADFLDEKPIFAAGADLEVKQGVTHFLFYWRLPNRLTEEEKHKLPDYLWPTAAVEVDSKTMTVQSVSILDPKR